MNKRTHPKDEDKGANGPMKITHPKEKDEGANGTMKESPGNHISHRTFKNLTSMLKIQIKGNYSKCGTSETIIAVL